MLPSRPARIESGPFSGKPRIAASVHRQRRALQPGHLEHCDVVVRVERDRARRQLGAGALSLHDRVVLPCDDVRVRDDEPARGDPAGALDPEPARRALDADHARGRVADLRVPRDRRPRRRHVRRRARDRRKRVEPRQRVQDRPRRRQHAVERAEDRRPLDVVAELPRPRRLQRHRTGEPRQGQSDRPRQQRAADAVEDPEARGGQPPPDPVPEDLQEASQDHPADQRAGEGEHRRVRRV